MTHYPFDWQVDDLCPLDFIHFHHQFSRTILQLIPFAQGPVCFFDADDFIENLSVIKKPQYWSRYIKKVLRKHRSILASEKPILFLPIWDAVSIIGIAAVEGVEEQFADALSEEWLSDRSRIISREFFLQKKQAHDPVTGMFNAQHLPDRLDDLLPVLKKFRPGTNNPAEEKTAATHITLFFIEIYPRANNAEKALSYILRAGYHLESLLGQGALHHIGSGVFAFIGEDLDEEQAGKLGKNILSWCRREGFHRIHIGINTCPSGEVSETEGLEERPDWQTFIEQTWQSLRKSRQRGPFALCTYSSLSNPDAHPLKKSKPAVISKLRKLWSAASSFAILLISQDREHEREMYARRLSALIGPRAEAILLNDHESFVFLTDADENEALNWARDLQKKMSRDPGSSYSIGIACYPCIDFKKTDIPQNARKALLHAEFFGPGTIVTFDGVSQNVSGDIYYSEGDLVRAVKEYRKGLELDPGNCNLLNSIGEAYAQMGKPRMARPFFESILQTDAKHYMGLFNLGMVNLSIGDDDQAMACFEKALAASRRLPEANQRNDLLLQLSKIYCRNRRYKKAVNLLTKEKITDESGTADPGRKALLRYLGEAFYGINKHAQAIMVLQRAVSYNPHDAFSLSMLGELYSLEKQGDDIALSLCEEAVNIDDRHWKHWYRLAWVRYRMAHYGEALNAVHECRLRGQNSIEAIFLAGKILEKLGATAKAINMFRKVLKLEPEHKAAEALIKKITTNN